MTVILSMDILYGTNRGFNSFQQTLTRIAIRS